MEAFWISAAVVALAEFGDKTQFLALALAARFRKPLPILLGIAVATLANHTLAAGLGAWIATALGAHRLRLILGLAFVAMALWTLFPDKPLEQRAAHRGWGVFGSTLIAFFLVEMGDKTQIATVALAAKFGALWTVVAGTTIGLLAADAPAVLLGEVAARRLPLHLLRVAAAAIFLILGTLLLVGVSYAPGGSR